MKLSFSTVGCPNWSWNDIVSSAADLGYNGIEVRVLGTERYAPKFRPFLQDNIDETKKMLKSRNLEIPCLSSGAIIGDEGFFEEVRAYIDLAQKLGVRYIRVMPEAQSAPTKRLDDKKITECLRPLGKEAKEKGVTILVETNGEYCESKRLNDVLDKCEGGVGALWDIHHTYRFGGESAEYTYDNLKDYIKHVHVKDAVKQRAEVKYVPIGNGDVPINDAVALLIDSGYDGYFSFERKKNLYDQMEDAGIGFMQYIDYMKNI